MKPTTRPAPRPAKPSGKRRLLWAAVILLGLTAGSAALWRHYFHRYTPLEVALDLKAAAAVRHSSRPVETFLEKRYGPLDDPANRQKAFLDFFNTGHIEGLQILARRIPDTQRRTNIVSMARWVADYRQSLTPAEKAALGAHFRSPEGRSQLQNATSRYLAQDVRYRAETSQVIAELMTTVSTVQKP